MGAAEANLSFDARRRLSGTTIGRYHVGPRIGAGGSAAVYLGRTRGDPKTSQIVAIKVVHEHLAEETEFISQFLDEANLLVRLSHPNIVRVHELQREGDSLCLVMEYLYGQPLSKVVSSLARRGERLSPTVVAWLGARVAEGLAYAHALKDENGRSLGLVHRDVSPQNVFLTYDGYVKLIDFGIARAEGRIAQTTLGRLKGKFSYMAPEQVLGRNFDHRADIFALGATLYEAAVGARLFAGVDQTDTLQKLLFEEIPDPRSRVADFPEELRRILLKSLANDPAERHQDGLELARDLDAFVGTASNPRHELAEVLTTRFADDRAEQDRSIHFLSSALSLAPPPDPERPSGMHTLAPPRRSRAVWVVAFSGLLALLALSVVLIVLRTKKLHETPPPVVLPASVSLEITTQPDANAKISVDGLVVEGHPARVVRERDDRAVEVVVEAEGFELTRLSVVPDHDQNIVVPLVKVAPPPSATPAPEPSATPKTRVQQRGSGTKRKDPLITKYPFPHR